MNSRSRTEPRRKRRSLLAYRHGCCHRLRYMCCATGAEPVVLLIHSLPGRSQAMRPALTMSLCGSSCSPASGAESPPDPGVANLGQRDPETRGKMRPAAKPRKGRRSESRHNVTVVTVSCSDGIETGFPKPLPASPARAAGNEDRACQPRNRKRSHHPPLSTGLAFAERRGLRHSSFWSTAWPRWCR